MSEYETAHLAPSEIDRLRLKAFSTNSQEDVTAYYKAASLYFQERDVRAMNRADRIEELKAKLAKAREEGFWAGRSCGGAKKEIDAALAKLKGQDDE